MHVTGEKRLSRTIAYFAVFTTLGLAHVLGPTLPGLAEHTRSQLNEISFLFTAMSLGYLIGSFQGGRLYDRIPGHLVMVVSLVISALMLTLIPLMTLLWLLVFAVFVQGMAGGALDVGGNTLLVWVHGRKVGPFMNALHLFFGLGSTVSPIIVTLGVLISGDITWAYWTLALLQLPVAAWLLRLRSPTAQVDSVVGFGDHGPTVRSQSTTRRRVLLALLVLLFFLYVGAEASFGGWIFTYALALGLASKATAGYLTSAFWGALTFGRFLGIPIAARFRPRWILFADLAGCLASVSVLLLWPNSPTAIWLGTVGLGFSMASIFPTVMSLAERRMTITGQITGWFLVGSSAGGMTLPWLIGQLFEPVGPQSVMYVIALDLIVAMGVFGTLMLYSREQLRLPKALLYNGKSR